MLYNILVFIYKIIKKLYLMQLNKMEMLYNLLVLNFKII